MKKWLKTTIGFAIISPVIVTIAPFTLYSAWSSIVIHLLGISTEFDTSIVPSCIILTVIPGLFAKIVNAKLKNQESQGENFLYTWALFTFPLPLLWLFISTFTSTDGAVALAYMVYIVLALIGSAISFKPLMTFYKKTKQK